ncbi:hypothetical protein GNG27_14975 [Leclercia sp. 119287]|uniref:helix-turn-helix transcriptional regulator n=1 Tax=Leclercia sp. 119287 TaxID=2681308 RepID=UPI0012E2D96A|nr:helix-turn-helix transcriptional regulator [Leclercia sp. 119287]QGU15905.1 hypothetical protein GNG27_14975 [Leclercia sp. 119287]
MTSAVKLHPYIYNLLIEKDFNEFSANHLRDALLKITDEYSEVSEARKFIYRQLHRLEALGFVCKIEKSDGRSKKFYKTTELFYSTAFTTGKIPKNSRLRTVQAKVDSEVSDLDIFLNDLKKEKLIHEAKLAVVLSEIEEYQSLMERFPTKKSYLTALYQQAKNQSAALLGRVTALSKVLGQNSNEHRTC